MTKREILNFHVFYFMIPRAVGRVIVMEGLVIDIGVWCLIFVCRAEGSGLARWVMERGWVVGDRTLYLRSTFVLGVLVPHIFD